MACYRESTGKGNRFVQSSSAKEKLMKLNLQIIVSASAAPVLAFAALDQDIFACRPMRSQMRLATRWLSKHYFETYSPPCDSRDIRRIKTSHDNW